MEDFDAFWFRLKDIIRRCYCPESFVDSLQPDSKLVGAIQQVRLLNMMVEVENAYGVSFTEKDPIYEILGTPRTLYSFIAQKIQKTDQDL